MIVNGQMDCHPSAQGTPLSPGRHNNVKKMTGIGGTTYEISVWGCPLDPPPMTTTITLLQRDSFWKSIQGQDSSVYRICLTLFCFISQCLYERVCEFTPLQSIYVGRANIISQYLGFWSGQYWSLLLLQSLVLVTRHCSKCHKQNILQKALRLINPYNRSFIHWHAHTMLCKKTRLSHFWPQQVKVLYMNLYCLHHFY